MVKVNCDACGAPYEVDPRRIPDKGLRMRCPACSNTFVVMRDGGTAKAALASAAPGAGRAVLPADDDIDLPAPVRRIAPVFAPTEPPPAPALESPAPELAEITDLPGLRQPAGPGARPTPAALTPNGTIDSPRTRTPQPSNQQGLDPFYADLPAPKQPAVTLPAPPLPGPPGGAFRVQRPSVGDTSARPAEPAAPAARKPIAPPISSTRPSETDLPALRGARTAPVESPREADSARFPAGPITAPFTGAPTLQAAPRVVVPEPAAPASSLLRSATPSVTDLPAVKVRSPGEAASGQRPAAEGSTAKRSFARPSLESSAGLSPIVDLTGLPKDSLAVEPKPLLGGPAQAMGALGDLDDVRFDVRPRNDGASVRPKPAANADARTAIPTSEVRETSKAGLGGRTMLGLGGHMPKDSLDLAPEFGRAPAARDLELLDAPATPDAFDAKETTDLPAPADLPRLKAGQSSNRPDIGFDRALVAPEEPDPVALSIPAAPRSSFTGAADSGLAFDFGELDLPAPSDLPRAKRPVNDLLGAALTDAPDFDLPAPSDLPVVKAVPEKRAEKSALDDLFDLAPEPRGGGQGQHAHQHGELSIDTGFDDLRLPRVESDRPGGANPGTLDLSPANLLATPRGRVPSAPELELGPAFGGLPGQSTPERGFSNIGTLGDLGGPREEPRPAERPSLDAFGELDLELDVKGGRTAAGLASTLSSREGEPQAAEADIGGKAEKQRKVQRSQAKRLPWWAIPFGLVATTGLVGTALGAFTEHGYFGVYLLEQMLPEAGDPARVHEALSQAERLSGSDTFSDAKKALLVLSDARNEAGLNRELLVQSLLHESLFQLRFGDDAGSAQRAAAILARIVERAPNAPGLALARAADALRRGDTAEATRFLASAPGDESAQYALVSGELALRMAKPADAAVQFQKAERAGGGARAAWGAARALSAAGKTKESAAELATTLKLSPLHADAHLLAARTALAEGRLSDAATAAAIAAGATPVGKASTRPSRAVRALAFGTLGMVEEARENLREAERAYEYALAADPSRLPALVGSGRTLMALGRPRDALSRFESALALNPSLTPDADGRIPRIEAALGAGQALLALERATEALPRLSELRKQFPERADIALWSGHALEASARPQEAEEAFRRAIELEPRVFAGYVALSQLLFKRDRTEEGARVLKEATGKVDDSAEVRRLLGMSELSRNHLPEALHQFEAALRFEPANLGALLGLATTQRKTGSLEAAEATLSRLSALDTTFGGLMLERGQLLESRGDYVAAVDAYRKALANTPNDVDLKLRLAAALVTAGRLDDAEKILPEVLKERPTSAEAEHFTGRLLFARGDAASAVQHLERAVQLDTLKAEYHMHLAWALLEQGSLAPALDSAQQALSRDPNLADAYWILGRIQMRTGAVKDALRNFERTLKLKPGRFEAYANMGDAYDELRELKPAIKAYETALRAAPERGDWWYRLGLLHLSDGGRDSARVTLSEAVLRGDRALEKPSWLADAHRAYADVLRESARTQEALDHYKIFLELAPAGHPDRTEIQRYVRGSNR